MSRASFRRNHFSSSSNTGLEPTGISGFGKIMV
jgi:hypothetical protein